MSAGAAATRAIDKVVGSAAEALAGVADGAVVMVGGFGGAGFPFALREALRQLGPRGLTIVSNNADFGGLAEQGSLARIICSYPVGPTSKAVIEGIEDGRIVLELTPQGTLAERIHAGGAGLGGVLTPTGIGTEFERDYRTVELDGRPYLLVPSLHADLALIRADRGDRLGNLVHRASGRNFNPLMAMAARVTVAEVAHLVDPEELDPDQVHTASAFVDRVVVTGPREGT